MANQNLSQFTEKTFVADADHTFIWDTAASISKRVSRNSWLNSGTLTSDAPVTISQTWNGTGSTVFKALVVNATTPGTTSSSSSLLLDLQVGTVSQVSVTKAGLTTSTTLALTATTNQLLKINASNWLGTDSSQVYLFNSGFGGPTVSFNNNNTIVVRSDGGFGWSGSGNATSSADTILLRDGAANTLALRNGGNAQTFRIYNTTDAGVTTYERAALGFSSNVFRIQTENLAGVTAPRDICLNPGTGNIQIAGNGTNASFSFPVSFGGTNTGKLGYFAGAFEIGSLIAAPLRLITGNVTRVTITDAGNVGIGTTAPRQALDISSSTAGGLWSYLQNTNSGSYSAFAVGNNISATKFTIYTLGSTYPSTSQYQANSTLFESLGDLYYNAPKHVFYSGNVGIGTTAPGSNLSVVGNMGVRNAATALGTGYGIEFDTNSTLPRFSFVFNSAYSSVIEQLSDTLRIKTLGTTTNLTFGSNSVPGQVVLKTDTGNLGIGTTSPTSKLHVAETWNAGGTTFAAAKVVVTDTASAAASTLLELWSDAITPTLKYSFGKSGAFKIFGGNSSEINCNQLVTNSGIAGNTDWGVYLTNSSGIILKDTLSLGWSSGVATLGADTILRRDGEADHLAMRRSTNGQKFSVYGTYPGAAWERFTITAPTSGNVLLGTYKGTGGIARGLEIQVDGTSRWLFNTSGHLLAAADNTYDIGANNANRPRNIFTAGAINIGSGFGVTFSGTTVLFPIASGNLRIGNTTDTSGYRLNGATLDYCKVQKFDGTGFGSIQGKLTTDTNYTAGSISPTGFLTLYDAQGNAYKVPCVAA